MWPVSPQLRTFGLHSRMSALFWHTSRKNDDMHMIKYDLTKRSTDFANHIPHRAFISSRSNHLIQPKSCPQPGQGHRQRQHFSHHRNDKPAHSVTRFAYHSKMGIRITNIGQQLQAIIRRQLHYLSLFPASTSYGFLRGALLPRPQTPHLAECTCVYTVVMRFVRASATRNTSRWRRSLTTALTAALLIFRSHQLL
jgi:hypothetical protein